MSDTPLRTPSPESTEAEAADERVANIRKNWYRDKKSFAITPHQILEGLNEDVLGQDEAKKDIAIAVANHINGHHAKIDGVPKNNVIIVGDTGSGKTLMMQTLRKIVQKVDYELAICDATKITEDGYSGLSTDSVLLDLFQKCDEDEEKAQRSIIYIDEIDKLLFDPKNPEGRLGVFTSFLKIIEGGNFYVTKCEGESSTIPLCTDKILFIVGGVCAGVDDLGEGGEVKQSIGFFSDVEKVEKVRKPKIVPEELMELGFPPEFIGRFDIITRLDPMTEDTMHRILEEKKVPEYAKLYAMNDKTLDLSDNEKQQIVKDAVVSKSGARGLNNALMSKLRDKVFAEEQPTSTNFKKITDLL